MTDRPLLGIALMMAFCVLAPLGDSLAKILGERHALLPLVTLRFAVQAAILAPLVLAAGGSLRLSPRALRLTAWRTALHIAGIGTMFAALRHLPIAEAIAISFVMPFLMLLLGRLVLAEEVGPLRLGACAVGFLGTLLVVQPTFADVGLPALLPLGVAVIFSLFLLVTRQIAKEADPLALQAVSGLMASAVLVPVCLLAGATLPGALERPSDLALLAALGVIGTLAHLVMTWSLRFAPAATLAPMQYLEIPMATFFGWAIFRDLPGALASFGIAVTVSAGLAIVLRERQLSRRAAAPAPDLPGPHPAPPPAG